MNQSHLGLIHDETPHTYMYFFTKFNVD